MKLKILLLFCAISLGAQAQLIVRDYQNRSMSDVLIDLRQSSERYQVAFIYNDLEDFMVTKHVSAADLPAAIRTVIGFYPLQMTVGDSLIVVECAQKSAARLIGQVADERGNGLPFCNVVLLATADSTFLTGGVTNEEGRFTIPCEVPEVVMKVSCIGYKDLTRTVKTGHVGTIRMLTDTYNLQTVEVKGQKPQYQLGREGMVTNVDGTVLSGAGTLRDVLKLLPNVAADDAKVQVFGHGEPLIYINNRKLYDAKELDQIRSEHVKTVEVITSPGAKYNAEVRSVIRIRTKRRQGEGLSGEFWSFGKQGSHRTDYYTDLSINYRSGGLDVGGGANYWKNDIWQRQTGTENVAGLVNQIYEAEPAGTSRDREMKLTVNYEFNENHAIGARYTLSASRYFDDESTLFYDQTYTDGRTQQTTIRNNPINDKTQPAHYANAYYNGRLGKLGIMFDADWLFKRSSREENHAVSYDGAYDHDVSTDNKRLTQFFATKLVLSYPVGRGSIDAGYEHTSSRLRQQYVLVGPEQDATHDHIKEATMAYFAEYQLPLGHWSATAGLRFEHNRSRYYQFDVLNQELSRTYNQLFPSASVAYENGKLSARLAVSRKTSRPSYSLLDSNKQYDSDYFYESGNPYLKPSTTTRLAFEGRYDWLMMSASVAHIHDCMVEWAEKFGSNGAVLSKLYNIDLNRAYNFTLGGSRTFGPWTPSYSATMIGSWCDYTQFGVSDHFFRPIWIFGLKNHFALPWKLSLRVDYEQYTRGRNHNRLLRAANNFSLALSRKFLSDRLGVSLRANDLFHSDMVRSQADYLLYNMELSTYSDSRYVRLDVVYRFNFAGSKYRGQGAGNDEKQRL